MRRGFKTKAERLAVELRQVLKLSAHAPLPARRLAQHLGIYIVAPASIKGMMPEVLREVLRPDNGWSAATLADTSPPIIIYNPTHSSWRQQSDLMHEIAHELEGHTPSGITLQDGLLLRDYDKHQEKEAEWLGGCLQITRDGLLWALSRGWTNEQIATHFNASIEMVRFRRNVTGVDYQLKRRRR